MLAYNYFIIYLISFLLYSCSVFQADNKAEMKELELKVKPEIVQDQSRNDQVNINTSQKVEEKSTSLKNKKNSEDLLKNGNQVTREEEQTGVKNNVSKSTAVQNDQANNQSDAWQKFFKPVPTLPQRVTLNEALKKINVVDDPQLILKKARSLRALGRLDLALTSYNSLLRIEKEHKAAMLEVAIIYLRKNQLDKAFSWLESLSMVMDKAEKVSQSFYFQYQYTLALAYQKRNYKSKSHAILIDLISRDQKFIPGYTALASSYIMDNKLEIAKYIIKRAMDTGKEEASIYSLLGVISEKKGQFEESEHWYEKALELSKDFVPALVNKSILEIRNYNLDTAELHLKRALTLEPANVEAHVVMSILYIKQKRFKDAKALLDKALVLDPHYSQTRYNLGLLSLYAFKKPIEALRLFHEAIQSESNKEYSPISDLAKSFVQDIKNINDTNKYLQ